MLPLRTQSARASLRRLRLAPVLAPCLAIAAVLVGACGDDSYRPGRAPERVAVVEGMPDWVNSPPLSDHLIYGVGTDLGHDESRALADGIADIARQLHITILGAKASDSSAGDSFADGTQPTLMTIDPLELPPISVAQRQDYPHCLYVQVCLDRQIWADSLLQRIATCDSAMAAILAKPAAQGDGRSVADAARRYQRLLPLLDQREKAVTHLQIAASDRSPPPPPITRSALHEQFARIIEQIGVDISTDSELDAIAPQLIGACANLGLHILHGQGVPVLSLRLKLHVDSSTVDGMQRETGEFDATTLLASDGRELGSFDIKLSASSLTTTVARDRLMSKVLANWEQYLGHDFIDCLTHL